MVAKTTKKRAAQSSGCRYDNTRHGFLFDIAQYCHGLFMRAGYNETMTANMTNAVPDGIVIRIVSGAQTGVDRAALDAALAMGVPAGGWVPEGRKAEDGIISAHYPVQELAGAGYRERTRQNVIDSDATLIVYFDELSGGTLATLRDCKQYKKPYCLIDASDTDIERAVEEIMAFIKSNAIAVLNVAGPRASGEVRAYDYTKQVLTELLTALQSANL